MYADLYAWALKAKPGAFVFETQDDPELLWSDEETHWQVATLAHIGAVLVKTEPAPGGGWRTVIKRTTRPVSARELRRAEKLVRWPAEGGARRCGICGSPFEPRGPQRYCSPACSAEARKRQIRDAVRRRREGRAAA